MQTEALSVGALFRPDRSFRTPLFQRRYIWTETDQLAPYWADVERRAALRLSGNKATTPHFMGAILLQAEAQSPIPNQHLQIIDGQQRLITLHLSVAALAAAAQARELDFIAAAARRRLENTEIAHPKLTGAEADAEHIRYAVKAGDQKSLSARWPDRFARGGARFRRSVGGPDCLAAYVSLLDWTNAFIDGTSIAAFDPSVRNASIAERADALLQAILEDFHLVAIFLAPEDDGPAIFEALNDRGAPLDAADLIRNDIVRRARINGEDAAAVIREYWQPFANDPFWRESELGGRARQLRIDNLLRYFLVSTGAGGPSTKRIFHAYRAYVQKSPPAFRSVADEVQQIALSGAHYRTLIDPKAPATHPCLADLGPRLKPWKPTAAIPPLLALANADALTPDERRSAGRAILGYIVRRTVCGLSRRNLHRTLASLCRHMQRDGCTKQTVMQYLADQLGIDSLWPANARFGNH